MINEMRARHERSVAYPITATREQEGPSEGDLYIHFPASTQNAIVDKLHNASKTTMGESNITEYGLA